MTTSQGLRTLEACDAEFFAVLGRSTPAFARSLRSLRDAAVDLS